MEQLSLFPLSNQQFFQPLPPPKNQQAIDKIRGLQYVVEREFDNKM